MLFIHFRFQLNQLNLILNARFLLELKKILNEFYFLKVYKETFLNGLQNL